MDRSDLSLYFFFPMGVPEPSQSELLMQVNASKLNVRSQPDSVSRVIRQYSKGEYVQVVVLSEDWAQTEDGGFVALRFLDMTSRS